MVIILVIMEIIMVIIVIITVIMVIITVIMVIIIVTIVGGMEGGIPNIARFERFKGQGSRFEV